MNFTEFIYKYKSNLDIGGRGETMQEALASLLESDGHIIVETGSVRMKDDWGAGMSTLVFGDFCKEFNRHLFSVDIDSNIIDIAKEITKDYSVFITHVVNDSIDFLKNFNQSIDLLYLDSKDCPEYDSPTSLQLIASQIHQLLEMEAAYDKLSHNSIVLLDDNQFINGGKTRLTKFFLKDHGFEEIMSGKQSLWIKKE